MISEGLTHLSRVETQGTDTCRERPVKPRRTSDKEIASVASHPLSTRAHHSTAAGDALLCGFACRSRTLQAEAGGGGERVIEQARTRKSQRGIDFTATSDPEPTSNLCHQALPQHQTSPEYRSRPARLTRLTSCTLPYDINCPMILHVRSLRHQADVLSPPLSLPCSSASAH